MGLFRLGPTHSAPEDQLGPWPIAGRARPTHGLKSLAQPDLWIFEGQARPGQLRVRVGLTHETSDWARADPWVLAQIDSSTLIVINSITTLESNATHILTNYVK